MVAFIQLTVAGADSGPFNLYSNVDGFTVPFGPSVSQAVLLAGYLTGDVPYGTTTVRVKSTGMCKNYVDILLTLPPIITCGTSVTLNIIGGNAGTEDSIIQMYPEGGVISIIANATVGYAKFELIHVGIKKATSAQTGLNGGPFENIWGMPTLYSVPTDADVLTLDQFIGSGKGAVPSRNAAYLAETGINYISAPAGKQMVWWKYSSSDYASGQQVILRMTGTTTSSFIGTNMCESSTTTSSTTEGPIRYNMTISIGVSSTTSACASSTFVDPVTSDAEFPFTSNYVFLPDGVTPFDGQNLWYMFLHMPEIVFKIDNVGLIIQTHYCT